MNGLIFGVIVLLTFAVVAISIKVFEQRSIIRRLRSDIEKHLRIIKELREQLN